MVVDSRRALLAAFASADFAPGDVVLEARSEDDVLAHVDVYWRSIAAGSIEISVAAIGQLATDPAFRGLGLASALVRAAHRVAVERGLEWSALYGDHPFYEKLGYRKPKEPPHPDFLVCPLVPGAEWPAGAIDTRGTW